MILVFVLLILKPKSVQLLCYLHNKKQAQHSLIRLIHGFGTDSRTGRGRCCVSIYCTNEILMRHSFSYQTNYIVPPSTWWWMNVYIDHVREVFFSNLTNEISFLNLYYSEFIIQWNSQQILGRIYII